MKHTHSLTGLHGGGILQQLLRTDCVVYQSKDGVRPTLAGGWLAKLAIVDLGSTGHFPPPHAQYARETSVFGVAQT